MEAELEDIAQATGFISYKDVWDTVRKANKDSEFRKLIWSIIAEWKDAVEDDNTVAMNDIVKKLKACVP